MLFRETVAVYCETHMEHTDTLCGQNTEFCMLKHVVHIVTTGLYRVNDENYKTPWWRDNLRLCLQKKKSQILRLSIWEEASLVNHLKPHRAGSHSGNTPDLCAQYASWNLRYYDCVFQFL
jgi:hypothetical protein